MVSSKSKWVGIDQYSTYAERIGQLAPDITVTSFSINRQGLLNDVVMISGGLSSASRNMSTASNI
jgi:hypothetical protein